MCVQFKKLGAKVVYHSDGDCRSIIPMLIEAGVDALQPLEARAGLDVQELKEKYGDKLAFIGNVDIKILTKGLKEKICSELKRKLDIAKEGGYIIGSSHSIGIDVPLEHYLFMVNFIHENGTF